VWGVSKRLPSLLLSADFKMLIMALAASGLKSDVLGSILQNEF
jgi:hypothetical protein